MANSAGDNLRLIHGIEAHREFLLTACYLDPARLVLAPREAPRGG